LFVVVSMDIPSEILIEFVRLISLEF